MKYHETTNVAAEGLPYFLPSQKVDSPGKAIATDLSNVPVLFHPIKIRDLTFNNRIWVAPMCQFSAGHDGQATLWHQMMLGSYAVRGAACVMTEVAAVLPCGRITPNDLGLWNDEQIGPLKSILDFVKAHGQVAAVQIGHAGRKGGVCPTWLGRKLVADEEGGFSDEIVGPSPVAWDSTFATPKELTVDNIAVLQQAFVDAAVRAYKAGAQVLDVHGAHGYLFSAFASPTSNHRTDQYGGTLENRVRLMMETLRRIRAAVPDLVIFYRISATDWTGDRGWTVDDTISFALMMHTEQLIDLLDVSSGGNDPSQQFPPLTQGYQVPLARAVKEALPDLHVTSVGLFSDAKVMNGVLDMGISSALMVGREFLRDPNFVLRCAYELQVEVYWPKQLNRSGYRYGTWQSKLHDQLEDEYNRPWLTAEEREAEKNKTAARE